MGLIQAQKERNKKTREQLASNAASALLEQLAEKDGKIHVAMFNCFGSLGATMVLPPDEKFNQQADTIIGEMQDAGYEIVDVKLDGQYGIGMSQKGISYHLMVLYR